MKRRLLFTLCCYMCYIPWATAVELTNLDEQVYDVKVVTPETTKRFSIKAHATHTNVCDKCTISVMGVDEIEAQGQDKILVREGQLEKK